MRSAILGGFVTLALASHSACDRSSQFHAAATPEAPPTQMALAGSVLDTAALTQTTDPARVLRFYGSAIEAQAWDVAARVWGEGSGMTGAQLAWFYGPARKTLRFGTGTAEGAAGSLYYETSITQRDETGVVVRKGTITLRRVNDVDGATPAQLRWHIERSTLERAPT